MELTATRPSVEPGADHPGARLIVVAIGAVTMNLVAALLIEEAASRPSRLSPLTVMLLGSAFMVNGGRFLLWRLAHRRYRFADVMPLTALFFPLIGLVSWLKGESMSWQSVGGIILITAGAWRLARGVNADVD